MDYPNNFATPVFPESRKIALARFAAVWYLILFFVIAALCGLLIWTARSVRVAPYLISVDSVTGEWLVISEESQTDGKVSRQIAMQESVVFNFAQRWFETSYAMIMSDVNRCECPLERCRTLEWVQCFVCCNSDDRLYRRFVEDVLPLHWRRLESGESWGLLRDSHQISPVVGPAESGGVWRMTALLQPGDHPPRNIEIYASIRRNMMLYPQTMGYYVADFNWYVKD